jgi:tetratricopeptide (TPR) repeat protein
MTRAWIAGFFLFLGFQAAASESSAPEVRCAFLPLSRAIGYQLPVYLTGDDTLVILPMKEVESETRWERPGEGELPDERQAAKIAQRLKADLFLWGRYTVAGKTARCTLFLIREWRTPAYSWEMTGRVDNWNALVERTVEEIYRLQGQTVPLALRRRWRDAPRLDESFKTYVEAMNPVNNRDVRMAELVEYLKTNPGDLQAGLILADWLYTGGKKAEAEGVYRGILERDPARGLAHSNLAFLLSERQAREEAQTHFEAALGCPDLYPETFLNYANFQRRQSLKDSAIRTYQKGIERFPNAAFLHYNLALCYDEKGFDTLEAESYKRAWELDKTLRPDLYASRYWQEDRWIEVDGR